MRIERGAAGGGPRLRQVVQILLGQARRAGDPWAVTRERSGDIFVGRTGRRALGVELRIISIGQNERPLDRAGAGAATDDAPVTPISVAGARAAGACGAGIPVIGGIGRNLSQRGDGEERDGDCGKGCNLRAPRNRPSPPSPPQHAHIPLPESLGRGYPTDYWATILL